MSKKLLPVLNYEQCAQAVAACLRARRAFLILGSPGVGKTACVRDASRAAGLPCHDLIASNMDPTDTAGLPYRGDDGHVHRELFPEIRAVCDAPGVLFLDEATTMPKSVEGPALRLVLERNAGGTPLHEGSRVGMACNPPEQAPGGIELSAALINRLILLKYRPSHEEVADYFFGRPVKAKPAIVSEEAFEEQRQLEWSDFAATLAYTSDLIMWDPPRAAIDDGEPWGSPRAWEIGLSAYAAYGASISSGKNDHVGYALLSGSVGVAAAGQYLAIRELRSGLPTVDEIRTRPAKARVPDKLDEQVASLGLIARVSHTDVWAAWIYTNRLPPEIGAASAHLLFDKPPQPGSPHARMGRDAQIQCLSRVHKKMNRC